MSAPPADRLNPTRASSARLPREIALGALFWLAFLLALEPGNIVRASAAGVHPSLARESLRIAAASLFAAPTCPMILWLVRRCPIAGADWVRNASIHAIVLAAIAPTMIVIGGLVATWLPPTSIRGGIPEQLAANVLLLMAAMAVLDAGAHLARRRVVADAAPAAAGLAPIAVTSRGRTVLLEIGELDWIEAQGNYLGLRAGGAVHLIRDTLTSFQSRLDPQAFVRIHRGRIVNLDRVREVVALGNGDALVRLRDGTELRASRGFSEALRSRLHDRERPDGIGT